MKLQGESLVQARLPMSRGYTGHEMLPSLDIVQMGGRIYDPNLARFLQADPNIQAPKNLQNYNRYSYVMNNPLTYTDPSGYFFKKLFKFVKKYWRAIVAVVATVLTYGAASSWLMSLGFSNMVTGAMSCYSVLSVGGGVLAGAISGFVGGAIATGSLKGGLQGALSGGVFGGLGAYFNANSVSSVNQTLAHASAGGVMSELQGGNFGHGFLTAGVMKAVSFGNTAASSAGMKELVGKTFIQAAVGGTLSRVTGGKFANGAITAAIQYTVNAQSNNIRRGWNKFTNNASKLWGDFEKYWQNSFDDEMNMVATQSKNSMLANLKDDTGLKVSGCAGFYFGGCAQVTVVKDGIIWSRGAGRVFGASGGVSYVGQNANATHGATSWESAVEVPFVTGSMELNLQQGSKPQFGWEIAPVQMGLSVSHTLMKHTHYKGN